MTDSVTHQTQVPPNNQMSAIDRIPDEDREGMEKPLSRLAKAIEAERTAPSRTTRETEK